MERETLLILVLATVSAATEFGKYSTGHGKKTYFQAARACKDRGKTLAMAKTAEDVAQLKMNFDELIPIENITEKYESKGDWEKEQVITIRRGWLGLDDLSDQGFKWIDGSHVSTMPFPVETRGIGEWDDQYGCFAIEANFHSINGKPVDLGKKEKMLVSTLCDTKLPYICGHQGGPATWTEWSYPEACSVNCGVGRARRTRECRRGLRTVDNSECRGRSTRWLDCHNVNVSCEEKPRTPNRTSCSNRVPGVKWTDFGYDITKLDLTPWYQSGKGPGGMKKPVVSVTCDNPGVKHYNGHQYQVSDQINRVTSLSTGGCNEHSVQLNSTNEISNKFSLNVGFEASYLSKFSFSASASYQKMSKTVKKKNKFFSELSCYYSHLRVNLQHKHYLQLDPQAQRVVDRIHEPLNPNSYIHQPQWQLIEEYGTHYFDEAVLGGKYLLTSEIDSSFLKHHSSKELSLAMKAKADIGSFSAETKNDAKTEDAELNQDFESMSNKYEQYFGGTIGLQEKDSREKWQNTTYGKPWILSGSVKPIYDLIHDDSKKLWVKQAVEQYVFQSFVESARELNVLNNAQVKKMIFRLSDKMLTLEDVTNLRNLLEQ